MAETNDFPGLSPMAMQRQQAMLPLLLTAVRHRRQRRRAVRAAALVVAVALVVAFLWPPTETMPRGDDGPIAQAPGWTSIHDDPTVLSRCEVTPVVAAEWFVDDASLQALLRAEGRPAGVVRVGGAVRVSAAAIDPWGSEIPEPDQVPGGTGS